MLLICSITSPSLSESKRTTWSMGPKTSSVSRSRESISKAWGATKLPFSQLLPSSTLAINFASLCMRSMWACNSFCAPESITGPRSLLKRRGSPAFSDAMAPLSICSTSSAISDWINNTRRAEQRCPALWKADIITSSTTCSGRALESTTIQF